MANKRVFHCTAETNILYVNCNLKIKQKEMFQIQSIAEGHLVWPSPTPHSQAPAVSWVLWLKAHGPLPWPVQVNEASDSCLYMTSAYDS